jgi:hypothetical protein
VSRVENVTVLASRAKEVKKCRILLGGNEYLIDRECALNSSKPVFFNIQRGVKIKRAHTWVIAALTSNGALRRAWEQRKPGTCVRVRDECGGDSVRTSAQCIMLFDVGH